ncbi:hypothetical protein BWP19_06515 [Stenotrophomonas maltophilia]|nr:DUF3693 domain-containing protein [Stenotrophomonas maltophilia]AIL06669.1 phage related family protein [Stenotrophomonas maltophilia]OOD17608.1 hypothetical protein BWP19_06515 [Stenotrophomonas maltophilia]QQA84833.1 hypothetical protein I6I01_10740 [Stenotrophomonas maltophilia]SNW10130.1 Phage related protein [Stenotrophomonas maltophilia]HDS1017864.1 hypothetical protein [Stenotrophomonas maltophilia]
MDTANDLLDKVKAACNFPSDNVLAQKIGLTRAMVSSWRHGRHPIPDERIAQMCALAKLDGPTWIAMLHAERAQTATERALWRLMLDRLSAAAAVVALVALSLPSIGNAKTAQNQAVSEGLLTHSVYYVTKRSAQPNPTSPVLAASCSPSSNPPNARRTRLHGANFSPSMQARRCRLDAPLKDGFGDAPG